MLQEGEGPPEEEEKLGGTLNVRKCRHRHSKKSGIAPKNIVACPETGVIVGPLPQIRSGLTKESVESVLVLFKKSRNAWLRMPALQ